MNTNNFKIFVEALEALPESIKNNNVNMASIAEPDPVCGTPGCFAGLVSIVAEDIPELKQAYKSNYYEYNEWEEALNIFLECTFRSWANYNYKSWGNTQGRDVFCSSVAFGVEVGDSLTHNMIIIHLRKALNKWIAFENKSNEHQYPKSEQ